LVDQPWTQWLTWPFQAVPTFFLVAGYAGAVSWTHRRHTQGAARQLSLRHRLARVLGPTTVYVTLVSAVVVVLDVCQVSGSTLEYAGWAVAMHLWFLAVYLIVVSLTPVAIAAQRRWGLLAPALLAAGVVGVDAVSLAGHLPYVGWLNYLLCWGTLYQLGMAWQHGLLAERRAVLLAAGSAVGLALLILLGPYPVSMIGVPGQTVQNTEPPSAAMLAFAGAQAGLVIALAPAINRMLRSNVGSRVLSVANRNVMSLYLWHMIPVVIVAIVGYPAGLLPQPVEGTGLWWIARLEWVVILSLVTAVEMVLLWWGRRLFATPLPMLAAPLYDRWAEPVLLAGAVMSAYGLAFVAAEGFAPNGHFPWVAALIFAVGVLLVALRPARTAERR
ncbi:MAG: acyltransferase family protein, partial [Mycobacterium sp.]|nr:acyltransferase family protein [Mycobacterium sp.]MBV9722717.1 acyltransferase family protein [Mycobacterium sp.]